MNRSIRPALESLEDRCVPAFYVVTGNADTGGLAPTAGNGTAGDPFQIATLRSAIEQTNNAAGMDTIDMSGLVGVNISLATALPALTGDTDIFGSGMNNLTVTRSAAPGTPSFRIFEVAPSVTVNISSLQITNGFAGGQGAAGTGGGLLNKGTTNLYMVNVVLNKASQGGGICNTGTLTVENSIVTQNTATAFGGGIFNTGSATVQSDTEISGNWGVNSAGGIANQGTFTLTATVIKGNDSLIGAGIGNGGTLNMSGGELKDNKSLGQNAQELLTTKGGGIYNSAGTATFNNVSITGNKAAKGGGFYSAGVGTVALQNCTLNGNTATILGPGGSWRPNMSHYTINGGTTNDAREPDGPGLIMNLAPNAGPLGGGTLVTITGEGLGDATAVFFGSTPAASFTVISDTEIQAVSPAASVIGMVHVSVVNDVGTSDQVSADQFNYLPNNSMSLTASASTVQTGQSVTFTATVTGSGATPTGTVQFWTVDPVTGANLTLLGTATLDQYGQAVFVWSSIPAGIHRVKAVYLGDANYTMNFAFFDLTVIGGGGE